MSSLRELEQRFAAAVLEPPARAEPGIAVYRNTVFGNYRNALAATYRVVRLLTGAAFFNTAVDAFVVAHPSTGGDLNVYGGEFADFLAAYPHGRELAYLPDVARLEWLLDCAQRAAPSGSSPEATLATLAATVPGDVSRLRFALDPSCGLLATPHPVMRIWQVHQPEHAGGKVDFDAGMDWLLVRREGELPSIERLGAADHAWLRELAAGSVLATALDAAVAVDSGFDLGAALRTHIATGVLTGVVSPA